MLHSPQARANVITEPAQSRIIGEYLATGLYLIQVVESLGFAPGAKRVGADTEQVSFGVARETKPRHSLA